MKHSFRGLTLMEVMLSIGLLSVAALSLLTVFISGLKLMQRSNDMAAANDLAQSTLEAIKRDFRTNGMTALPAGAYLYDGRVPDPIEVSGPNDFPPTPYPGLTVNDQDYQIVVEGRDEGSRLRRVSVSVYWADNPPLRLETILHP